MQNKAFTWRVVSNSRNEKAFSIRSASGGEFYLVPFDRATTAAEKWDWLRHLREKEEWVTADMLFALIKAFDEYVPSFEVTA